MSQKNPGDSDICRARPLGPSDAIHTCTVDESSEDKLTALVLRGCSENSNGKVVPRACHHTETLFRYLRMCTPKVLIVPSSSLLWVPGMNRGQLGRTLGDKNRSVDSDRLVRVQFIVHIDDSCSGDEVGAGEAGRWNPN